MSGESFEQVLTQCGVTDATLAPAEREALERGGFLLFHDVLAPNEVGDASSVLAFHGHLLHAGTQNRSAAARRVLQCQYVACELARPGAAEHEAPAHWSHAVRLLMGH